MYETMLNDVKEKMKPVVDMAEVNKRAAERLIALQSACVNDLMSSGFAQMNALVSVRDPREAFQLQMNYFKSLEAKLTDTAEKEMAVVTDAREEISQLIEKSVADMGETPWANQVNSMMDNFSTVTKGIKPVAAEVVAEEPKKTTSRRKTAA